MNESKTASEVGYKGTHRHVLSTCPDCGRRKWVRLINGKPLFLRCRHCAPRAKSRREEMSNSSCWKGGKTKRSGYVCIKLAKGSPFYPMAHKSGYVLEHRLVMAKHLGRCLLPWEVVHHKPPGVKDDNRLENLQLLSSGKYHLVDSSTKYFIKRLQDKLNRQDRQIEQLQKRVTLLEAENALKATGVTYD